MPPLGNTNEYVSSSTAPTTISDNNNSQNLSLISAKSAEPLPSLQKDLPSTTGEFGFVKVGHGNKQTILPYLLRIDSCSPDTKRMVLCHRIVAEKWLNHYLFKLNPDVVGCGLVKSALMTDVECSLLNEINTRHCDGLYCSQPFSIANDFLMYYEDVVEFYEFARFCLHKFGRDDFSDNFAPRIADRCGFIRINDASVVPYVRRAGEKYVPIFYFEGETDSLRQKSIQLESWDLTYLKFCCTIQGIKDELYSNTTCLVTTLQEIQAYFTDDTVFEDYWPELPSNHDIRRVPTTHVNLPAWYELTELPPSSVSVRAIPAPRDNRKRPAPPAQNQQRMPNDVPTHYRQQWDTILQNGHSMNQPQYQYRIQHAPHVQPPRPPRAAQQMPRSAAAQNSQQYVVANGPSQQAGMGQRTPNNRTRHSAQTYYPAAQISSSGHHNAAPSLVNNHSPAQQQAMTNVTNSYRPIMQTNTGAYPAQQMPLQMAQQVPQRMQQQVPQQMAQQVPYAYTNGGYVPPLPQLTPISANARQTNGMASSPPARQPQPPAIPAIPTPSLSASEVIDLLSPPGSPNAATEERGLSAIVNKALLYSDELWRNIFIVPEPTIVMSNSAPHRVELVKLREVDVASVNAVPYDFSEHLIKLTALLALFKADMKTIRQLLQDVLKISLYKGNSIQTQLLDSCPNTVSYDGFVPLVLSQDIIPALPRMSYVLDNKCTSGQMPNNNAAPQNTYAKRVKFP